MLDAMCSITLKQLRPSFGRREIVVVLFSSANNTNGREFLKDCADSRYLRIKNWVAARGCVM
jgi:hypothetical protein